MNPRLCHLKTLRMRGPLALQDCKYSPYLNLRNETQRRPRLRRLDHVMIQLEDGRDAQF